MGEDSSYFRVELTCMALTEVVFNNSVGYLRTCNEPLFHKMRMACSLSQLQHAYMEEACDDNVDKLIDAGALSFVPVIIKFQSGITRTLYHSYDDLTCMMDELSGVDLSLLNRTSYNLEKRRYGIKGK